MSFLDKTGLTYFWGKIKSYLGANYMKVVKSTTAPADTSVMWVDTSVASKPRLKFYDTTAAAWVSYATTADNADYVNSKTPVFNGDANLTFKDLQIGRQNTEREGGELIFQSANNSAYVDIHIDQLSDTLRIFDYNTFKFFTYHSCTGDVDIPGNLTLSSGVKLK